MRTLYLCEQDSVPSVDLSPCPMPIPAIPSGYQTTKNTRSQNTGTSNNSLMRETPPMSDSVGWKSRGHPHRSRESRSCPDSQKGGERAQGKPCKHSPVPLPPPQREKEPRMQQTKNQSSEKVQPKEQEGIPHESFMLHSVSRTEFQLEKRSSEEK